ncbi:MAG: hypothetical protein ACRDU8_05070, partial [Egibacteraceae bacterium]
MRTTKAWVAGRRVLSIAVALACAAAVLTVAPSAALSSPSDDPAVEEAAEELRGARAGQEAAEAALDAAAGAYELARAHDVRLREGLRDADARLGSAQSGVDDAEGLFAHRVAQAYKHPGGGFAFAQVLVLGGDAPTALHRLAVLERAAANGALRVDHADRAAELTVDGVTQERIVAAGTAAATRQLQRRAAELEADLAA